MVARLVLPPEGTIDSSQTLLHLRQKEAEFQPTAQREEQRTVQSALASSEA